MSCCWRGCTRPIGSSGRGRRSTVRMCGRLGGRKDRPEPSRSLPERLQTPSDRLRARHAARCLAHWRQPHRHHADDPARGCDPAGAWPARPSAPPTGQAVCRSRLPLTRGPSPATSARHPGEVAWPKSPHGSGLGKKRWVVERTIAWLHQYRRLRIRYERCDDIHEAFLAIGCSLICLKLLQTEKSFRL
jgi:transposase